MNKFSCRNLILVLFPNAVEEFNCNSLLVEGGGNKYKVAGYTLYLAKLVANCCNTLLFIIFTFILPFLAIVNLAIFDSFEQRIKTLCFIT